MTIVTTIIIVINSKKKAVHLTVIFTIIFIIAFAIPNNTKTLVDDLLRLLFPKELRFSLARRQYQSYYSITQMKTMNHLCEYFTATIATTECSSASFDQNTMRYCARECHLNPHRSSNRDTHMCSLIVTSRFLDVIGAVIATTKNRFDEFIVAKSLRCCSMINNNSAFNYSLRDGLNMIGGCYSNGSKSILELYHVTQIIIIIVMV